MNEPQSPLRLRKKHAPGASQDANAARGERIVQAQSMRNAISAGAISIILFCFLWVAVTSLTNRVFPWFTVLLGYAVGYSVRQAGRGVDWRFPLLAGVLALFGSLLANIVVAASVTAEELGTGTFQILRAVTNLTWPVFFSEVWNIAHTVFAITAAIVAAFFAKRRLNRSDNFALQLLREQQQHNKN